MVQFPNIDPEIFSVNILGMNLALRWYAVSYILGFFCAIKLMKHFIKKQYLWLNERPPMSESDADNLLTYLILGVILGGRLGYVLFYNFNYYLFHPLDVLRIWDGGMAFHGGFIGVIIAVVIYCLSNSISLWSAADLIAVSTPPGLFFGRVANFINAELWGSPTTLPWGVVFPGDLAQQCGDVSGPCARHPSQLYEAVLEGFFLFILLYLLCRYGALKRPGLITGIFAVCYGVSRFVVEYFRVPDPQFFSELNPGGYAYTINEIGITMGQALSLPMIAVGFTVFLFSLKKITN